MRVLTQKGIKLPSLVASSAHQTWFLAERIFLWSEMVFIENQNERIRVPRLVGGGIAKSPDDKPMAPSLSLQIVDRRCRTSSTYWVLGVQVNASSHLEFPGPGGKSTAKLVFRNT